MNYPIGFFKCNYCPFESPHFKGLVNHYLDCHANNIKDKVKGRIKFFSPTDLEVCESLAFTIHKAIEEYEQKQKGKANVSS